VLSGTKQGRDAILAYFGELGAPSQGSFHTESNGKTLDLATAIAFVLRDGVIEAREFIEDTAKADAFWA
jgi:hypothetical protein